MEKFCAIIPNRPGRELLYSNCLRQLNRMTRKPGKIYNINFSPKTESVDIGDRINEGVKLAKIEGFDLCYCIENDDAYPIDYFERFGNMEADFFGDENTIYYHLTQRAWELTSHQRRSSLFTTGFRISALKDFIFPTNTPFVDIALWKHAQWTKGKKMFVDSGAVGIKGHGIGKMGGKGHQQNMPNKDYDLKWLKSHINNESFKFYHDYFINNTERGEPFSGTKYFSWQELKHI